LLCLIAIDSNRFHVVKYTLTDERIKKPFHAVFLSDLHNKQYGKNNEKLLAAIDAAMPDAVLIGGDILTAKPGEAVSGAAAFVKTLADRHPVYYANGNHEQRLVYYPEKYGDMGACYEQLLSEAGISRLVNSGQDFGQEIEIVGCELDRSFYKRFKKTEMPDGYLDKILPPKDRHKYTILLAHNPDYFPQYAGWGAELVLSGHVHGGVVRIPGVGGVISTNFRLFPKYDGGLFREGNAVMILSRGLGAHTIPFRLFNPGELVDITVKPSE
jgi:hypothetical protein